MISAGFSTTVLPQARAGATFQEAMLRGKFHGVMRPTTPSGSRKVMSTPSSTGKVLGPLLDDVAEAPEKPRPVGYADGMPRRPRLSGAGHRGVELLSAGLVELRYDLLSCGIDDSVHGMVHPGRLEGQEAIM